MLRNIGCNSHSTHTRMTVVSKSRFAKKGRGHSYCYGSHVHSCPRLVGRHYYALPFWKLNNSLAPASFGDPKRVDTARLGKKVILVKFSRCTKRLWDERLVYLWILDNKCWNSMCHVAFYTPKVQSHAGAFFDLAAMTLLRVDYWMKSYSG